MRAEGENHPTRIIRRRNRASPGQKRIAAYHELVGVVPDPEIAAMADVSLGTVRNYRRAHGIGSTHRSKSERAKVAGARPTSRRSGRSSPLDAFVHLLGTMPDREVAERAGVSMGSVYQYRRNRQIPSLRARKRSGASSNAEPSPPKPTTPTIAAPSNTSVAWKVVFEGGEERIAIGDTLVRAVEATAHSGFGGVLAIERIGLALVG
jgi:transcriptional regulator with XRE-family HTH domain